MRTFALEVKDFNVRMLNVNPATFDTGMANALQYQAAGIDAAYEDKAVGKMLGYMKSGTAVLSGDVQKGVQAMYDVIMGAGPGEGRLNEPHLPLGVAAAHFVSQQAAAAQRTLAAFGELSMSVDKAPPA